jgi:predicted nucleic acid-binding protein
MQGPRIVVVDADVYCQLFPQRRASRGRATAWRASLAGSTVVIAVQTRAEVLTGALGNWGWDRMRATREQLDRTAPAPIDNAVVDAAQLTADCQRVGYALHDKLQVADRWVASTAIAHNLPLLSGDAFFREAPGCDSSGGRAMRVFVAESERFRRP